MESERITHTFEPIFDKDSKILILGTMPSPKSREVGFYYSHPRNRFWQVLGKIFDEDVPKTTAEKKSFVLKHKIALWDVLKECDISGASDSSIKNAVPNDIGIILENSDIRAVFTSGSAAAKLYKKFIEPKTSISAISLPSTSPANAKIGLDELCDKYSVISEYINKPTL